MFIAVCLKYCAHYLVKLGFIAFDKSAFISCDKISLHAVCSATCVVSHHDMWHGSTPHRNIRLIPKVSCPNLQEEFEQNDFIINNPIFRWLLDLNTQIFLLSNSIIDLRCGKHLGNLESSYHLMMLVARLSTAPCHWWMPCISYYFGNIFLKGNIEDFSFFLRELFINHIITGDNAQCVQVSILYNMIVNNMVQAYLSSSLFGYYKYNIWKTLQGKSFSLEYILQTKCWEMPISLQF